MLWIVRVVVNYRKFCRLQVKNLLHLKLGQMYKTCSVRDIDYFMICAKQYMQCKQLLSWRERRRSHKSLGFMYLRVEISFLIRIRLFFIRHNFRLQEPEWFQELSRVTRDLPSKPFLHYSFLYLFSTNSATIRTDTRTSFFRLG